MARFRRRRFGGSKFVKKRLAWDPFISNEFAHPMDGTSAESVLFTTDPYRHGGANTRIKVRRIIGHFQLSMVPAVTTLAFDVVTMFWALLTRDSEDTDITLLSIGEGTLLASERILQVGSDGCTMIEVPSAIIGQPHVPPLRIDFDWRGQLWVNPEEELLLVTQFGSSITSTVTDARLSGIARTLYEVI